MNLMKKLGGIIMPKKKKEKVPDAPIADQETTNIITTESAEAGSEKKVIDANVEYYKKHYQGMFGAADFGVVRSDSEMCNLLFGILIELKKLNENKNKNPNA